MLSAGALIWISVRPLLRLVLCTLCGFVITKLDIFPQVAARGVGQILLNITYPCLMFSKIVPAFTPENVSALGPLVLVAVTYQLLGIIIAWIVKQFFWVPHRFRYGILVAGGWANVGDVPTAIILSITGNAPFNGTEDQNIAVAYVAVFILVFFVSLFPMGGHRMIAWDYVGPEVDDSEVRMSIAERSRQSFVDFKRLFRPTGEKSTIDSRGKSEDIDIEGCRSGTKEHTLHEKESAELGHDPIAEVVEELRERPDSILNARHDRNEQIHEKHVTFQAEDSTAVPSEVFASQLCSPIHTNTHPSRAPSPFPSTTHVDESLTTHTDLPKNVTSNTTSSTPPILLHKLRQKHVILPRLLTFLRSFLTPQAIAIFTAFPIALLTPLKALFTPVPGYTSIPNAPDGQPILAFILDTASFIGAASVPMGLICLGSALARLKIPRGQSQWGRLPVKAIVGLALGKMVVMPVIGVVLVQGLVHGGVIESGQKVLRFVCIFIACTPTATTQVFLTQVYSGTGSAETLSAFLIPQYALMFVTMTVLCAFTLTLIF